MSKSRNWTLTAPLPSPDCLSLPQSTPEQAYEAVDVPDSVIDIIVNLRNYLQVRRGERC